METDDVHKQRFETDGFGRKFDEEQKDKIRLSPYLVVSRRYTPVGEVEVCGGIYSRSEHPSFSMHVSVEKCRYNDTYVALHGRRGFRCEGYFGPLLTGNSKFSVARKTLELVLKEINETQKDVIIELIQLVIEKKDDVKYYYLKIR
ncbi:MAG: hypothetical protein Q8N88_07010 [Nanoarchaeota archaeon]|nr:hypothetical protein [Nanoarchaeota archaeon]